MGRLTRWFEELCAAWVFLDQREREEYALQVGAILVAIAVLATYLVR